MKELAKTKYQVVKKKVIGRKRVTHSKLARDLQNRNLDENVSKDDRPGLYHHEEYIDMCRGPHVPHMGFATTSHYLT